jgi:hypothetical protein
MAATTAGAMVLSVDANDDFNESFVSRPVP